MTGASTSPDKVQPSEAEVLDASRSILESNSELGIGKLLAKLQQEHAWALSEKRLKNILEQGGLRGSAGNGKTNGSSATPSSNNQKKKSGKVKSNHSSAPSYIPQSHIDAQLPIPAGVRALYFDDVKGKGLVADRDFQEGDTIFTEEAFIAAPPSHALKQVEGGELCTACFAPLNSSLVVQCGQKDCFARFCNRLCQSRGNSTHHQLLCPGQNTSIKPFVKYLSLQRWLSLSLVSRMLAQILLTHASNGQGPPSNRASTSGSTANGSAHRAGHNGDDIVRASLEETLAHLDAFATVSELERRARNPGWDVEREAYLRGMQEGHRLLCQGMDPRIPHKGRYPVRSSDFPADVAQSLFSWDTFLRMLGRANLNSEAQGGMYLVHSHFNHSCAPNISVRHPPHPRSGVRQATKVAAVALRDIKAGEELLITYQQPDLPLLRRRMLLWREYMFGPCMCTRCVEDEAMLNDEERKAMHDGEWTRDAQAEEEIAKRKAHADMIEQLDKERRDKLASEGKPVPDIKDLNGLEDELRSSLGF